MAKKGRFAKYLGYFMKITLNFDKDDEFCRPAFKAGL